MGLYGHRNHLSLIQLMEDPKMHKKEKKLLNKFSQLYTMGCGSWNSQYMPPFSIWCYTPILSKLTWQLRGEAKIGQQFATNTVNIQFYGILFMFSAQGKLFYANEFYQVALSMHYLVHIYTTKDEYWTRSIMLSDPDRVLRIYI